MKLRTAVTAAALLVAFGFAAAASVEEQPPLATDKIPAAIRDAVASPDRPDADKALDAGRQPAQMLAFFGVAPGMEVADVYAGGGYTTELLARVVGPKGKVYSQEPVFPPELKQIEDAWTARLAKPALANVVAVHKSLKDDDFVLAPPGTLDVVVLNMNYHDLVLQGIDRGKVNGAVLKALKSGGVYGIVDHSAPPNGGIESLNLHRIDQGQLTAEVERSGFKLAAASSALRHPEDTRTWSTSPKVAGEKRGQSDRFVLRFVKP
jgi:predicted methyltransferase